MMMQSFARMVEGRVAEVFPPLVDEHGTEVPISARFHPDFVAQLVAYDPANPPEEPAAPAPTLSGLKQALMAATTTKRWEVETGGIELPGGVHVATGTADQNRITTVVANAAAAGVSSVDFKAASGWVTLSLSSLQAVASAIALHVQACFSAERAHHEAIAALGTIQAAQAYDVTTGWPE